MSRRAVTVRRLQIGGIAEFPATDANIREWKRSLYGSEAVAKNPTLLEPDALSGSIQYRLTEASNLEDAWWSLVYGAGREGLAMVKPTFPARQTLDAHGDAWWRDIPDRPTAGQPEAFNAYLRRAAELNIPITPAVRIEARRAGGNTKHRPVETFVRGQEASGIAKMFADQRATTAAQNAAHAAAAEERRRALEAAGYVLQTATTAPVVPTLTASQQADLIAKGYIAPAPTATATVTPAGPTAKAAEPVTLPAAVTAPSTVTTVEPAGPTADTRAWEWRQVVAAAKTLPTPAKIGAGLAVAGLLYALFSPSTETAHAPRYR